MTNPVPRDRALLAQASQSLREAVERSGLDASTDLRLRLLEGTAARVGGFDLERFDQVVGGLDVCNGLTAHAAMELTDHLAQAVMESPIPPPLALATLGDSDLDPVARRRQGSYFTDSRLALNLTSGVQDRAERATSILDPACGAGVLLVATALQASFNSDHRTHLVREVLWGVDRDPNAVRAARAAISSLTCDLGAVACLCQRLLVADSLLVGQRWWKDLSSAGFDLVIGNPPWEKLKVTRHEHALSEGHLHHYGDDYRVSEIEEDTLQSDRLVVQSYRELASADLAYQGRGEADLFKMFVELGARLTSKSGALAFFVPAGLIRNDGARDLRQWLFSNFDTDVVVLDNRERYFGIDSRFKFIKLLATRGRGTNRSTRFGSACIGDTSDQEKVETSLVELQRLQPDLAIPEVRGQDEWELFSRLRRAHWAFGDIESGWYPRFCREVDMTNDRAKFIDATNNVDGISVIEGRMVHHHRVSAKRYVSGRGRRSVWEAQFPFHAPLRSQWLVRPVDLRPEVNLRIQHLRAGFCDITGQTNERTVLAALIPNGVVCGNKVPTIDFALDSQASAWVGIANSFAFDWLARRSVTTTLSFFILRGLPIPTWEVGNTHLMTIARWSQVLADLERYGGCGDGEEFLWSMARIRARIEVLSARLYGISVTDLDQMMRDFPQVDQVQLPLRGEVMSTVTRDLIVESGEGWATPSQMEEARVRVMFAQSIGSVPFVPNQHARVYLRKS